MPNTTSLSLPKELWEAPPGSSLTPSTRPFTFHEIPHLRHLLPECRGRPGFVYAQITNQNIRRAQDEGWKKVEGSVVYTIIGPKGEVDMELMVRGGLIPGQSHDAGARLLVVDETVEKVTGLKIPVLWGKEESPDPTPSKETPNAAIPKNGPQAGKPT